MFSVKYITVHKIKKLGWLYEQEYSNTTMGKWTDHYSLTRDIIFLGP